MVMTERKKIAALQKLFIIDEQGAYAGEYTVDDECTVGFDDFVTAVGEMAMGDSQTVFIGENKATMLHGTHNVGMRVDQRHLVFVPQSASARQHLHPTHLVLRTFR